MQDMNQNIATTSAKETISGPKKDLGSLSQKMMLPGAQDYLDEKIDEIIKREVADKVMQE
jgi:hypothetical protein